MRNVLIIAASLILSAPTAIATPSGTLAGAEICGESSCNGWVIGVHNDEDNESYVINNGPTGGSPCSNSTSNWGLAVLGDNNMCSGEATCEVCNVTVEKRPEGSAFLR